MVSARLTAEVGGRAGLMVTDPMMFLDIYSEEWMDPENAAKYTPPLGPVWDG